jgi:hypothetical protein
MKVTNRLGLPLAFVRAVSTERHNAPGCFSATTLNKGAKEIVLTDRHWDEITVDAADQVWAVFGTAVHTIFENCPDDNFHEEKFDVAVSNSHVTGKVDSYDLENGIIYDWKTASTWKLQVGNFEEWDAQGLVYAWLLTKSGLEVKACRFVALLKDHSKTKAEHDASYPEKPVVIHELKVTPEKLAETEKRIIAKVEAIEAAYKLGDDDIEPCTEVERWDEGKEWAVMKNGRKSAVKCFRAAENPNAQADAEAYAGELGNSYYVEYRPPVSRKCKYYCDCCEYCNFYKSMHKGEN